MIVECKVKVSTKQTTESKKKKFSIQEVEKDETQKRYEERIQNKLETTRKPDSIEEKWKVLKDCITEVAKNSGV